MRGPGDIQLRAALLGSFEREVADARQDVVAAMGAAMVELTGESTMRLRDDVSASGMRRHARLRSAAWRSKTYGVGKSLEPAGLIYSKIPLIVQAFENGVTIRARGGKGLLIPNPDVWPAGRAQQRRQRTNMSDLWAQAESRFGPLRVVKRPGKNPVVVAEVRESRTRAGTFRKASATARRRSAEGRASGLTTVVVFVIAKEAKLPRLLRSATIKAHLQRTAPARMQSLFSMHLNLRHQEVARR